MLVALGITIAACCWLISAGPGVEDGSQPWQPGSMLRVLTTLMALDFEYPTPRGTEVKWLIQGLGAAAALLVGVAAWFASTRRNDEETGELLQQSELDGSQADSHNGPRLEPAGMAQLAFLAFAAWAMISSKWAPWPELAIGEGLRQLIVIVWAIAIGRTLTRRGAKSAALTLAGILAITAVVGIWYRIERNPVQRLKFPIGNPLFLASCLLPGITLAFSWLVAAVVRTVSGIHGRNTAKRAATIRERLPEEQTNPNLLGSTHRTAWTYGLAIGSLLGLIAMVWAFKWTDARGPQIGLAAGLVVACCVWAKGRLRRGLLAAILIGLIVAGVYVYFFGWPDFVTRRIETFMFRFYCWSYALQLFLEQPFIGKGQTAYALLSQALSTPHAEYAPSLFPGQLMGHAHSEWLEILADLGAVGLSLMAVALGATFWSASVALQHARDGLERATVFGLVAAFAGIVIAEATGVALRMPGSPVIFYTVIGLLWAMSQADPKPGPSVACSWRSLRLAILGGGMFASVAIGTWVIRDWQGTLAEELSSTHARDYRWDEAIRQAEIAREQRWLVIEGRLSAENQYNVVAYQAAVYRFQQFRDMLARLEGSSRPSAHTLQLAREDSAVFNHYVDCCVESGSALLDRMPQYPYVAGRMANVLLLAQQMDVAERQLGLRKEVRSLMPAARKWLLDEYNRDRLDPQIALKLFRMSEDRPSAELIDLLRRPLRLGPWTPEEKSQEEAPTHFMLDLFGEFEAALAALMQKPDYAKAMETYIARARACANISDVASWADPYAPETLRLAARTHKLHRRFDNAVRLTEEAIHLSDKLTDRFGALVSYALIDKSRYLLLAHPNEPTLAEQACQRAIDRWPTSGDKSLGKALRRSLAFYLLAAGDEPGARQSLVCLDPRWSTQDLDRLIGYGLFELCHKMEGAFGPDALPKWFDDRLQRYLELVPDLSDGRLFAAYIALSRDQTRIALAHIEVMVSLVNDAEQVARSVITLLQRFPTNTDLQRYARTRFGIVPAASQPATTTPATEPTVTMPTTTTAIEPLR